jgi:hypothetical protein
VIAGIFGKRIMLHKALTALVVVAGMSICSPAAHAAAVSYSFAGVIDASDPSLPSNFQAGHTFGGTFSVDSTVVPNQPNNGEQFVYEALLSFSVNFGGYVATKTGVPGAEVQVDVHGGPQSLHDRYGLTVRGVTGGNIGGFTISDIVSSRLDATDHNVFPGFTAANSSPSLPTQFSLADFNSSGFFFSMNPVSPADSSLQPFDGGGVSGHFTDLRVLPEPGSLTLIAIGMVTLGGAFFRRRRGVAA